MTHQVVVMVVVVVVVVSVVVVVVVSGREVAVVSGGGPRVCRGTGRGKTDVSRRVRGATNELGIDETKAEPHRKRHAPLVEGAASGGREQLIGPERGIKKPIGRGREPPHSFVSVQEVSYPSVPSHENVLRAISLRGCDGRAACLLSVCCTRQGPSCEAPGAFGLRQNKQMSRRDLWRGFSPVSL
ncbi:unnamed protein product [Boreogadus saida]